MRLTLRKYQDDAVNALMGFLRHFPDRVGLVCIPTGGGKSVVLAEIVRRVCEKRADSRVLMLCPRRELVAQNAEELLSLWPQADVGIYSAGLKRRQLDRRVTVASVQSIYRRMEVLPPQTLILIDECHLTREDGEGMFNRVIAAAREKNPQLRIAGCSATPWRLASGLLTEDSGIFTDMVYEIGILELIRQGYLAPLKSKAALTEVDLSAVTTRGGEYVQHEMEAAFDVEELTRSAVGEMLVFGHDRKSWLVFAAGVKHAKNVTRIMREEGISAEYITGDTPGEERAALIQRFKRQQIRALVSVETITTGFNAKCVDLVAVLRATKSPGLFIQMLGRGTRLSPETGKKDCVVLDFSGALQHFGPIDQIRIRKNRGNGVGSPIELSPTKTCPECRSVVGVRTSECPECAFPFSRLTPAHSPTASDAPLFSTEVKPERREVKEVDYYRHEKEGKTPSMRAKYSTGKFYSVSEWVCFEHTGFPRRKALEWWKARGGQDPVPTTVDEAVERSGELRRVLAVNVLKEGKFDRVASVELGEVPEPLAWVPPSEDENLDALFGLVPDEVGG